MAVNTRIKLKRDTRAHWNAATGFIPLEGEVIIYTDYSSYTTTENNETITRYVPNFKVGDGTTYVQDLPFVDKELRDMLIAHINNLDIHVTRNDKAFWNNKLNYDSARDVEHRVLTNNTLVFTRD